LKPGIELAACAACGAAYFPARLLCPRCGGARWSSLVVREGVVEETTCVRHAVGTAEEGPRILATVRLPAGQRVVAGLERELPPGSPVELCEAGGAVLAYPVGP
jgi:uncharacterized OB-fold protein